MVVVLILGVTVFLVFNGYRNIVGSYAYIADKMELQQQKRSLMSAMYDAALVRTPLLLQMLAETDVFELDTLNQKLGQSARDFIRKREALYQLKLSAEEKLLLKKQSELIHQAEPLQIRIAELIMDDRRETARQVLFDKAIPAQAKVLEHISSLVGLYNQNTYSLISMVNGKIDVAGRNFALIASAIVLVSFISILIILSRMSKREERALQENLQKTREMAEQMEVAKQKLTRFTNALATYTAMLTPDGIVELVNETAAASAGLPIKNFIGRALYDCYWWNYDENSVERLRHDLRECAGGKRIDREARIQIVGGNFIFIRFILTPIYDNNGNITNLVAEGQDITERKRAAEKLTYQASHDDLTGLINRLEFENRLEMLLQRSADDITHFVFYLDLDQFKVVNDTCGHTAGDELLRQIPQCVKPCIRRSDVLARLGGDEFGIILEHCEQSVALNIAKSIIRAVSEFQFCWEDKTFRIGVSIGMLAIDDSMTELGEVLKYIDSACYAAKDAGRNCFHQYKLDDHKLQLRESEMDWVARIEDAIQQNRLVLYAQTIKPIADRQAGKHSFELLVRMTEEDGTVIPPGAFLPSAERYNKMLAIDRWVVKEAVTLLQASPEFLDEVGYCSINISCQSLADRDFLSFLVDQLSRCEGISEKICLEITETAAISNLSLAMRFITILRGLGVRFALDDFGSGLSSFAYLKTLPVDYLKIDGMFVKDIVEDEMDRAMVKSIHEVASVMKLKTIAEFVENEAIFEELSKIGIDYAQGYGIDKPQPLMDFISGKRVVGKASKIISLARHKGRGN